MTVVLMAPLAIDAAMHIGADPRMLAMGVALAATSGFASPYAHPGNLLIMGPGHYRFLDYVRIGLPVGLLTLAGSVVLLMRIYMGRLCAELPTDVHLPHLTSFWWFR